MLNLIVLGALNLSWLKTSDQLISLSLRDFSNYGNTITDRGHAITNYAPADTLCSAGVNNWAGS